ncbi:DUF5780 domain-containing protein [Clostridium saccharobutylicum]|uniref:DUF5780 domain-containing protein n=1 Tax=Clostridium saccharobutylicum DSM 13864 TaxID=1345695 RepID=U5MV86_CLOSA|nr:DUF5780 domain-containing protein [Clostridium saccharobutylicum]AGX43556.1 hypothetical protein CLSA_c25850 [Clostridium saccharobutylicum DSM 13864]AQR90854.1 hypothetical protein CLOSC_25750 [Clostridium saccharobutylicum]AQS00758.1 hypothetical protein CSACC_25820 [Clostridium saccharobutylicum]AQS10420.1 hypothetical protein CLOBY_25630 [Clostridium saccharobutylicum]AQS14741.1 hypothetical protein CLOSACC_25820 [Clostridium saccharobutylicum]
MKNSKKLILIIFLVTTLTTGLVGCKTNLEKIQDNLNKDDYSDAFNQIRRVSTDEDKSKLMDMLNNKVNDIKEQFMNGQIDGTLAISNLQKFKNIKGMEDTISNYIKEINALMDSQKGFADGQRGEKEKDYATALEGYSNVISSDSEHYEIAQAKFKELSNTVEAESLATIEKTKIHVNNTSNKNLYPDQMQVIMNNKSQKIITKFTVGILGYDENGNPIEIKNTQNDYTGYEFIGAGENISIMPGEAWGEQYGWNLASDNKIKTILACVKTLEFKDGSKWENPLYNIWLQEHKEKNNKSKMS